MSPLDFIPPQYKVAAIALVVALAAAAVLAYGHAQLVKGERIGRAAVQAKWDADVRSQQAEAIAQGAANAKETQRRLERQGDAQREQQAELQRYVRATADARAAARGFELRVDQLAAAARRGASDTATAGERTAGAAAAGMLAELSRGADARSELYARDADTARRAGVLCERNYDALTPTNSSPTER